VGEITIKIPQKIKRSYRIDSSEYAEEIIQDLDSHSRESTVVAQVNGNRLENLRNLAESYRQSPDPETEIAADTAKTWRERWNR
jgi:hypothetical protein